MIESGITVSPVNKPIIVDEIIPINIPPLIFFISNIIAINKPTTPIKICELNLAKPIIVAGLEETIPKVLRPINAIKRPIPPVTDIFKQSGIAFAIFYLIPPIDKKKKNTP